MGFEWSDKLPIYTFSKRGTQHVSYPPKTECLEDIWYWGETGQLKDWYATWKEE